MCEVAVGVSNMVLVGIVVYDDAGEFVFIVVLDGSCDKVGNSETEAYVDCDGNKDDVETADDDIV